MEFSIGGPYPPTNPAYWTIFFLNFFLGGRGKIDNFCFCFVFEKNRSLDTHLDSILCMRGHFLDMASQASWLFYFHLELLSQDNVLCKFCSLLSAIWLTRFCWRIYLHWYNHRYLQIFLPSKPPWSTQCWC